MTTKRDHRHNGSGGSGEPDLNEADRSSPPGTAAHRRSAGPTVGRLPYPSLGGARASDRWSTGGTHSASHRHMSTGQTIHRPRPSTDSPGHPNRPERPAGRTLAGSTEPPDPRRPDRP